MASLYTACVVDYCPHAADCRVEFPNGVPHLHACAPHTLHMLHATYIVARVAPLPCPGRRCAALRRFVFTGMAGPW